MKIIANLSHGRDAEVTFVADDDGHPEILNIDGPTHSEDMDMIYAQCAEHIDDLDDSRIADMKESMEPLKNPIQRMAFGAGYTRGALRSASYHLRAYMKYQDDRHIADAYGSIRSALMLQDLIDEADKND